jgi:uncharacterized RDD family membrane protein YckC
MEENNQTTPAPVTHSESKTHGHHPVMASFWKRLGAFLVDTFIISIATSPVNFAMGFARGSMGLGLNPAMSAPQDPAVALSAMSGLMAMSSFISFGVYVLVAYFYFGYFYSTKGQTPGKMLLKIKVVNAANLANLDWNAAFIRDGLMKMVSSILVYLGFFWYFASPKRQTWHDIVAKSYVVETDDLGNILMAGPESYPASKAKAFAFPCGCCLFYVLIIAATVMMIGSAASEVSKSVKHNEVLKQQMQQEMNSLEDYNGREDMQDQMNQMNQQQMQMLQQMNQQQMDQMMESYRNTPEGN